jgi:hypothetical protein
VSRGPVILWVEKVREEVTVDEEWSGKAGEEKGDRVRLE